jgi:uncharacterized protein
MMTKKVFGPTLPLFVALLLALSGCASTQSSRFYMLASMSGVPTPEATAPFDPAVSIGLGPVTLPDYLDRPQIVTRTSANTVQIAEYERWAEPLSSSVPRTLAENLTVLLHSDSIVPYPWPGSIDVTYQIMVDVYRFLGSPGDQATLDAQWSVVGKKGKKVLLLKRSTFVEPAGGASFEALVAAQSRALGKLSREIASALQILSQDGGHE